MTEPARFRYRAFISYAHRDAAAAKWLHRGIERFRIDKDLVGRESPLGPIPETLAPVFRDRDEFTAGHSLTEQTLEALNASAALIVICSPAAAASRYVNEEIRLFRHHHPERPVIPLIVDGTPGDLDQECFPPALRFQLDADGVITDKPNEVLAADWREEADGRELARAKIIARLLGLGTDDVYRRAERARRRANRIRAGVAASLLLLAGVSGYTYWQLQEREQEIADVQSIVDTLLPQGSAQAREAGAEGRQSLADAIQAIARGAGEDPRYRQALDLLAQGKPEAAEPLLEAVARDEEARAEQNRKEAAAAYRNLGSIAFLSDTQKAMAAYKKATSLDPDDPEGWNRLGQLQFRTGALDAAINSFERVLRIGNTLEDKEREAIATHNLGNIYFTRGELDRAEAMYLRALDLNEELGRKEGVAMQSGGLGLIYWQRGELHRAEAMHKRQLELAKEIGSRESETLATSGLALVFQAKGDLDRATEYHERDLELSEELGSKEGQARATGNLGLIYRRRGELARAEAMHLKSLEIDEALGRKEGMAADYGNLGVIYRRRGELARAEAMHLKSLEIEKELGRKEGMAADYGNLGLIYAQRGEFDRAEAMFKRQLELAGELGIKEQQAAATGNLGLIYLKRGELDRAEAMFQRDLKLSEELGSKEGQAAATGNLGSLYQQRGDTARACQHWARARALYAEMGMPDAEEYARALRDFGCPEE